MPVTITVQRDFKVNALTFKQLGEPLIIYLQVIIDLIFKCMESFSQLVFVDLTRTKK